MRFSNLTFLLVAASATFGLAAPAEASSNTEASTSSEQWTCKNGWELCGTCNGTSCKVGGLNRSCDVGSCAGPEGGDGKDCGFKSGGDTQCPGGY